MFQLCRPIKINGLRCVSPALSGTAFCYFHSRAHTMAKTKSIVWDTINLPMLEDSASIQVAISPEEEVEELTLEEVDKT